MEQVTCRTYLEAIPLDDISTRDGNIIWGDVINLDEYVGRPSQYKLSKKNMQVQQNYMRSFISLPTMKLVYINMPLV